MEAVDVGSREIIVLRRDRKKSKDLERVGAKLPNEPVAMKMELSCPG